MNIQESKVLVTGATGMLGSHLAKEFLNIKCKSLRSIGSERFNLRNFKDACDAIEGHDIVIHCAASCGGIGANQDNPAKFFYDNMKMGMNVIDACHTHNAKKLVVIGTTCSYPSETPIPFKEESLFCGRPEPTNEPYGIAKLALLTMLQAYRKQYGLNGIYLIPANMCGEFDSFDESRSHVIPALIKKFDTDADSVTLWGDGTPTREFLYAGDCAKAIILAAEKYDEPEPINIGTGISWTISAIAGMIAKKMNYKGQIIWDTTKPNGQMRRQLCNKKAHEKFGFKATTSIDQMLDKTIQYYKAFVK